MADTHEGERWKVVQTLHGIATIESGADWVCECDVYRADLISAAPRLLAENARLREALEEARGELRNYDRDEFGFARSSVRDVISTIDSALSAAGEEG